MRQMSMMAASGAGGNGGGKKPLKIPVDKVDITTEAGKQKIKRLIFASLDVVNLGTIPTTRDGLNSWITTMLNTPWTVKKNKFSDGAIAFVEIIRMVINLHTTGRDFLLDVIMEWQEDDE